MVMTTARLSPEQLSAFHDDGYLILPGLLRSDEVQLLLDTFMTMHAGGPIPGCWEGTGHDWTGRAPALPHPFRH